MQQPCRHSELLYIYMYLPTLYIYSNGWLHLYQTNTTQFRTHTLATKCNHLTWVRHTTTTYVSERFRSRSSNFRRRPFTHVRWKRGGYVRGLLAVNKCSSKSKILFYLYFWLSLTHLFSPLVLRTGRECWSLSINDMCECKTLSTPGWCWWLSDLMIWHCWFSYRSRHFAQRWASTICFCSTDELLTSTDLKVPDVLWK